MIGKVFVNISTDFSNDESCDDFMQSPSPEGKN